MNDLIMYLKVINQNLGTLHHNLAGKGFFTVHPLTDEYYHKIGDMTDDLIEIGIVLGNKEPSIQDAVIAYAASLISIENREAGDTVKLTNDMFVQLISKMEQARNEVPVYIQSKLDEYMYYLQKENYKLNQYLGGMQINTTVDIDDD